jgi:hypothetical protein
LGESVTRRCSYQPFWCAARASSEKDWPADCGLLAKVKEAGWQTTAAQAGLWPVTCGDVSSLD